MSRRVATMLLYAEDFRGVGHVNRSLTLIRRVLATHDRATAVLVTGSRVPDIFEFPPRADFIKLPPRRPWTYSGQTPEKAEEARLELGGGDAELKERYCRLRSAVLRAATLELAPDVVVVDNEPLGFEDEFREGLYGLKASRPSCCFVYHMPDIFGDPVYIRDQWRRHGVYQALDDLYDAIVVSGSPRIWNVAERYDLPPEARSRLHYVGYLVRDVSTTDQSDIRRRYGLAPSGRVVLVTAGGGHVGFPVLRAAVQALAEIKADHPDVEGLLVAGPLQSPERVEELRALGGAGQRVVRDADTYELMFAADVIVSMSGYNSTAEALTAARPLILAPQPPQGRHMREQLLRAETLASRGLARCIPLESITPGALAEALRWGLGCDRAAFARKVRDLGLSFDGADRLARLIGAYLPQE
jgi:predicted glycosyltransferase